jgi:integrase
MPGLPEGQAKDRACEKKNRNQRSRNGSLRRSVELARHGAKQVISSPADTLLVEALRIQNSRMTVASFVKDKFVPGHVASLRLSGRSHYRAILKHVLTPEEVDRIFLVDRPMSRRRLNAVQDWPYLDNVRLCDARPEHIDRLISAGMEQGFSTQMVLHVRSVISAVFTYAQKEGCFAGKNPASRTRIPKVIRMPEHALTLSQAKEVLAAMKYPEREIAIFAILTGLSIAEICGLQWKNVNLTETAQWAGDELIPPKSILVRKQWYRGELASVLKNRKKSRSIPDSVLLILLGLSTRERFAGPNDFVFPSRNGSPITEANIVLRRLKPIGADLQMPWLSWRVFLRAHMTLHTELGIYLQRSIAIVARDVYPAQYEAEDKWRQSYDSELPY